MMKAKEKTKTKAKAKEKAREKAKANKWERSKDAEPGGCGEAEVRP
jgi:hypothetical protein